MLTRDGGEMRYAALRDGWPIGVATPALSIGRVRAIAAA